MSKFNSLTPEIKSSLPAIREEWLRIGLSTEPADRVAAEEGMRVAYAAVGMDPPQIIIWLRSPKEGTLGAWLLSYYGDQVRAQVRAQVWAQVRAQVRAQVGAQVRAQVWDQVVAQVVAQIRAQVGAQIRAQVGAQVGAQVRDQVWDQVWAQVVAQVEAQVEAQLGAQLGAQITSSIFGQHDAAWLSFYWVFREIVPDVKRLDGLFQIARSAGWWWPFSEAVILTDRPEVVSFSKGILHRDGGPAIRYRDGFSIWALNGVKVPQWIAETDPDRLDPRRMVEIDNAEVRREFVRKVGIERVLYNLSPGPVDVSGTYELHLLDFGDNREPRPYLKMLNPSLPEVWHVEGVHPSCRTVEQAIAWRNGLDATDPPRGNLYPRQLT